MDPAFLRLLLYGGIRSTCHCLLQQRCLILIRGGTYLTKINFFKVLQAVSYGHIWRLTESKADFAWSWNLGPHPAILLFDFPIIGPKKSRHELYIWVSKGEKYKSNEKKICPIRQTSEEKNLGNHPKTPYFRKVVFSDMSDWANSFPIALVFFSW